MKKTIVFLMGLVCAFSLTACGDKSSSDIFSQHSASESSDISESIESDMSTDKDSISKKIKVNTSISRGRGHTVGLKSDGTVIATGNNEYGQCNVSDWTDIRIPQ